MSTKEDVNNKLKLKVDILVYSHVEGVACLERTDFVQMELWIEFKRKAAEVAFEDLSIDPLGSH